MYALHVHTRYLSFSWYPPSPGGPGQPVYIFLMIINIFLIQLFYIWWNVIIVYWVISEMDRRKIFNPSLMSQNNIFNLLNYIDAEELDTDVDDDFSDDDHDYVLVAHNNMENIFDSDDNENTERHFAIDESIIEPGTSNSKTQHEKAETKQVEN